MRLLQCDNKGNIILTKFDESNIPEYAILSHTWAQDNTKEVTYAEVINGTGHEKEGFKKIRFCGEQASGDGLLYFWVDTCCIDKDNRAELSHSINSMFRWYRRASKCYVYLSDVSTSKQESGDQLSEYTWESGFRKSRWFTRGWTLQELLAPTSVEFFSREGKRLGNKKTLETQIYDLTNIPASALQGKSLSQISIDERMRWMEYRETGQEEDKAYSLLGIFGVTMFPIYGEGVAKAFDRLWDKLREMQKCMQDLRLTDPRDDKERIEATKGGLLEEAYRWVIDTSDFQQWRTSQHNRLLWIMGDPGKGKTMLLCGIADELQKSAKSGILSYFFCQATDSRINHATAVIRGLIYLLADQQPSLVLHIQTSYDKAGKVLFEDANSWVAVTKIFSSILQDPNLDDIYLIIDALDECVVDLPRLLDFIAQSSSARVKWVVSSRNWPEIQKRLDTATQKQRLCLELNADSISTAVATFIQTKVHELATRNKYTSQAQDAVHQYLSLNADGTFLWAALVCQELSNLSGWKAVKKLKAFPPGLDKLYQQMLDQIMKSEDSELCMSVLAVVSAVYRPITIDELVTLVELPDNVDEEALVEIVSYCRSFLTLRERTIFFVHQSAKDFLVGKASEDPYLFQKQDVHHIIFSRSLQAMSKTLEHDIYSLAAPGILLDQVKPPCPDPLATIRYPCLYWADHLLECNIERVIQETKDGGSVYRFLYQSFLYWLEALSLMRNLSECIGIIRLLKNRVQDGGGAQLYAFIHDAERFALYSGSIITQAPLQLYCSALIFAPAKIIVRMAYEKCIPHWIQTRPKVEAEWNATLQTLEGHTGSVRSVAFSPDGTQVVSGSDDSTVRLWDAATGAALQTLEGHTSSVSSVAFSPDSTQVVSGSYDKTVRLWDTATGIALQTLEGHTDPVNSVAFSPDGTQVVSCSRDETVRLWDATTGIVLQTLKGHTNSVSLAAFSPDGTQVVSGSDDKTVRLWDTATGTVLQTLEGHTHWVSSVAFSPDGTHVVTCPYDRIVRLWDAATGSALQTLEGHTNWVNSAAFSPDGMQVVSCSRDKTVRLWDATTGTVLQTLEGHTDWVSSAAFSPDGTHVVTCPYDRIVRLWDAATGSALQTPGGHTNWVSSVAFSQDGNLLPILHVINSWIVEGDTNILWLPPNYRKWCSATWNSSLVIGRSDGTISFYKFTEGGKLINQY